MAITSSESSLVASNENRVYLTNFVFLFPLIS